MNQSIPIEKVALMHFNVCFERHSFMEQIQALVKENAELKAKIATLEQKLGDK